MLKGRRGPWIAGGIAAALIVLTIVFLVVPKMGQVSQGREELEGAKAEQGTLESQLAALAQAEAAAPEAEAAIRESDQLIPPTADQPGFLLLIKNAASQSGVTVTSYAPGNPVFDPATGLATIALPLEATGSYFALTEFLYRLETLPRAAKVGDVQMAPDGGGGGGGDAGDGTTTTTTGTLRMSVSVTLFTTDANAGPGASQGETAEPDGSSPEATVPETGVEP